MDDASFERLSQYIIKTYGIKLPLAKRSMLESRLNKKVRTLGMDNYASFVDYIFSDKGRESELFHVVDLITTNKTDFFREPAHFQFLSDTFLPASIHEPRFQSLKVWSAGCSTGEEPYSLLMVLEEFKRKHVSFNYSMLASDISVRVMQKAHQGIYHADRIEVVPPEWRPVYFLKGKDSHRGLVRIKPVFRSRIAYRRINLMEAFDTMRLGSWDIIFCRNVLIYFDRVLQEQVIRKLATCLNPGGLLFLGHSESIMGMDMPLKQIRPTIYKLSHGAA